MTTEQQIETRRFLSCYLGDDGAALVLDAIAVTAVNDERTIIYRFTDLLGVVVEVAACECCRVVVLVSEPSEQV